MVCHARNPNFRLQKSPVSADQLGGNCSRLKRANTHLYQVEEIGRLCNGVCAHSTRVPIEKHLFGLLVDHVKELLQAYGCVALMVVQMLGCY